MRIHTTMISIITTLILAASSAAGAEHVSPRIALILEGANRQVGATPFYDGSYRSIPFPGGDVPLERGVCSDVIIRAYRHAGLDLQVLVHDDMSRNFRLYPHLWGLSRPDPNIDHRRVPNLAMFFRRHGQSVPVSFRREDYRAGDIVTWRLPSGVTHIGLISDRLMSGRLLVIHNIGAGVQLEDVLFTYEITGHYRYDP